MSTWVETTVAIEFAASWKPFMKSNASASNTRNISVSETAPMSIRSWPSRVFEYDAFDRIRDVLALVGGRLERLVHRFQLDELARVLLVAE